MLRKKSTLPLLCLLLTTTPATAHQVKTSANVGATAHFEPRDRPQAQEPTTAWFALTKKGGVQIPLQDCRCQLRFWQKLGQKNPVTLPLQAIDVEKYQGVPSTTITFPQPGVYVLEIAGQPVKQGKFQPFRLEFEAMVAAGAKAVNKQAAPISLRERSANASNSPAPATSSQTSLLPYLVGGPLLLGLGFMAIRRQ
jgi:hypothetical protein